VKVYSFPHGGILFDDPYAPSREGSVLSFLPWLVVIPFMQDNGNMSSPVVHSGEKVHEGMLIGEARGEDSVNLHSSIPGNVLRTVSWDIEDISSMISCQGLLIKLGGAFDKLGKVAKEQQWLGLSARELQHIISDYGIVEMEDSGRPLSAVIAPYEDLGPPLSLVVRCVFDDAWLVADYVLCKERLDELAEGAFIAAKMVKAEKIILAVSAPERKLGEEILAAMHRFLRENSIHGIAPLLVLVGSRYPQRHQRELEIVLRRFEKKEKEQFGPFIYMGPATICAVYDAVKYRKPILDRYLAVGGSALARPAVLKVRIGSRLKQVFEECGGFISNPKRIAIGSPFLGRAISSMDEPVMPYTSAVFAVADNDSILNSNPRVLSMRSMYRHTDLNSEKMPYASAVQCICCGECRTVCPVGLDPEKLYKKIVENEIDEKIKSLAMKCHGCGCCALVCPSFLPLSQCIVTVIPVTERDSPLNIQDQEEN
jgi:electron transport complex protein RnfC